MKCHRYVSVKKRLKKGGLVPANVPADVMKLIQRNKKWAGRVKARVGRKQQRSGMKIGQEEQNHEKGEKRKRIEEIYIYIKFTGIDEMSTSA